MNPVIAIPAYNRPHYLEPVLESWRGVRGIEQAHMICRCEPGHPEMLELIFREAPQVALLDVSVNEHQLGNDQNMLAAVDAGFATGAGFVIAAEDDVLVAHDLLEYMLAMADRYAADPQVLAVTAFQGDGRGPLDEVRRAAWFWGGACWGIWRDRWDEVKGGWPPSGGGYDGYLWRICERDGRDTIQPLATRCRNIGEYGVNTAGEACGFAEVWERQRFTPDIPPQSYREAGR